jgi:hypothetical protein
MRSSFLFLILTEVLFASIGLGCHGTLDASSVERRNLASSFSFGVWRECVVGAHQMMHVFLPSFLFGK